MIGPAITVANWQLLKKLNLSVLLTAQEK